MVELEPWRFDAARSQWTPERARPAPGRELAALTVATYNVWFARYQRDLRWNALLAEVARCDPDVIALQEVTPPFLDLMCRTPWVRRGYAVSDCDGRTLERYGVVLFARPAIERLTLHDMPSQMGRKLLVARLAGSPAVATIHLESLRPSEEYRELQFRRCVDILDAFDHAVLMGDMNFCASWPENRRVPGRYTDVWAHLHPGDPGYSEDTTINHMLREYEGEPKQVRYDRVFLHSRGRAWRAGAIERLGTRPIAGHERLFPSDHFGLCARFTRAHGE